MSRRIRIDPNTPRAPRAGLPIPSDEGALRERLTREERELGTRLAELEARMRRFESEDRPRYETWLRLELGPQHQALEEIFDRIRERRLHVERMQDERSDFERDVDARRRAKLEAKRAERKDRKDRKDRKERDKQERAEETNPDAPGAPVPSAARGRLVALYRALARQLHPDAGPALPAGRAHQLWLEVQEAYERASVERLLAITAWLEGSAPASRAPAARAIESPLGERFQRLRAMQAACAKLERGLERLAQDPAWEFESLGTRERRKLRQEGARHLEERIARAYAALEEIEELVAELESLQRSRRGRR